VRAFCEKIGPAPIEGETDSLPWEKEVPAMADESTQGEKSASSAEKRASWPYPFNLVNLQKNVSVIALIATMATFLGAIISSVTVLQRDSPKVSDALPLLEAIGRNDKKIDDISKEISRINGVLKNLPDINSLPDEYKLNAQIVEIQSQINQLKGSIGKIETVILEDPAKALAIPLIMKDLDSMRNSYRSDLLGTKEEISRIYDQNKWFIGLMFTMAIGLLGLGISNFMQIRKA
jgi:hypothetical protein